MRIVYLLTSLGMGRAERQVLVLAARMVQPGHRVAIFALGPRLSEEWPTAIDVIHLDMLRNPASVLAGLMRARLLLKDFQPDLIHSHSFHANMIARWLKFSTPAKVISTVHNLYKGGWHRMIACRLIDFLSVRTTAVSTAAAERFVRLKAIPKRKSIVATNGIDTAEFAADTERRAQMRAAMSAGKSLIWLSAGRIASAKDIPNLLRAFALVRATQPAAQLLTGGEGEPTASCSPRRGSECLWPRGRDHGYAEPAAVRAPEESGLHAQRPEHDTPALALASNRRVKTRT